MHKGYTLNYFINFFKNIPDHRWTTDTLHKEDTVQYCALGHCLVDQRTGELQEDNARAQALQNFLGGNVEAINDDGDTYGHLGSTPRGRVLAALRRRKRGQDLT